MEDLDKPRTGPHRTFARHRGTWAIYGLLGYFAFLETVLGPLMPFLRAERGYSYTVASLHFGAFAFGGVLVGACGDRLAAWWGRWAALWGGGAGMAVGTILLAASPAAVGTLTGALVMGFFGSLLLIATQAILADLHGEWTAVAITESNVAASVCAILASLAVGIFAAWGLGWRAALALPVAALVLLGIRFARDSMAPRAHSEPRRDESRLALSMSFWAYCSLLFVGVSIEWCMAYWGAEFLDNGLDLSRSKAASALSLFFVGMLGGRVGGSLLARTLRADRLLLVTLCVALAGFPMFWLAPQPALGLLGLFTMGLGMGSVYPLTISVGIAAGAPRTITATARLALAGSSAILIAPLMVGAFADRVGIESAFGIVLPFLVIAIGLSLLAARLGGAKNHELDELAG